MKQEFEQIRAYKDKDIPIVIKRLIASRWFVRNCRLMLFPRLPAYLNFIADIGLKIFLYLKLTPIKTTIDLHNKIIIDKVVSNIIFKTTDGISFQGLEKLDRSKPYLFVSNHRDIALDPLLLNYILCSNGFHPAEIGFGNNLMFNEPLTDLIRIYGSFIIKRDIPKREKIKAVINLSTYIKFRLEEGHSIWIAQRKGRAKDGFDKTNPSVIKMLYYSRKKAGVPFVDFINSVNLIPVAVSYELDPLDRLKAWELLEIERKGFHVKGKMEDMTSVIYGMRGDKGRINCSIGDRVTDECRNINEASEYIDKEIYRNYMLWPTNYIAYDLLTGTDTYRDKYSDTEKNKFLQRYKNLKEEVYRIILRTYANPVSNGRSRPSTT
ncbi:MAG: 1-acyl-sn-glycerol-3-phosphate acyltransferase [Spirochaetaceae bacterium]|nr:1-acyl-sn-glycerol-3-phosphate acyltransferase [Spirochaetaceae bacterium]